MRPVWATERDHETRKSSKRKSAHTTLLSGIVFTKKIYIVGSGTNHKLVKVDCHRAWSLQVEGKVVIVFIDSPLPTSEHFLSSQAPNHEPAKEQDHVLHILAPSRAVCARHTAYRNKTDCSKNRSVK